MRRPVLSFALLAVAAVSALVPLLLAALAAPAQAAGHDQKASYTCQYDGAESGAKTPNGLPAPDLPSTGGSDDVAVAVTVDAPAKVAAGEPLKLKGSATFTFGPNATATNGSSEFTFFTDSFGLDVIDGGQHRFLRIAELTSTKSEPGSSEVKASWTLPDYLVPTTTTGQLKLSLPNQADVTNPVSTSPESVDFTGELRTNSTIQPKRTVACALPEGKDQKTGIGSVRVTPASDTASVSGGSASSGGAAPSGGSAGAAAASLGSSAAGLTAPGAAKAASAAAPVEAQTALAGEPIPPATVAQGLRVPAWAMSFVVAFVLGGPFLAVRSWRRTRNISGEPKTRLRRLGVPAAVVATLALLAVSTPLTPQAPASAATGQAQITLTCVYEAQGSSSSDVPKDQPTGVSISLDVPKSVTPGQVVTLTGSASVQAPEDIRRQASQLGYTTLDAISDSFSVGLTMGGKRQVFLADRWQTGKTAFGNPLVVRGPLNFPAFKVPDNASGSIKLELPRNEVVNRRPAPYRNAHTPPKVAVEFMASVSGNGTSATYIVSCWRNDNGPGSIANIPVSSGSAAVTSGNTATAGSAGTTPAGAAPGAATPAGKALAAGAGKATGPAATGTEATAAGAPALQGAAASTTPVSAPAMSQDVLIPTWLAVLAGLLALGGYGFAGWRSLLRSRALRHRPGA